MTPVTATLVVGPDTASINTHPGDRSWSYLDPLLKNIKYSLQAAPSDRRGCVISNSKYGFDYFVRRHADVQRDPNFWDEVLGHSLAQKSARLLNLGGPCLSIAGACATGLQSVIFAAQRILNGEADSMVCAAAEASKVPVIEAAFDSMGVLSQRGVCNPFDKDRDGFVMGEGAGLCVLEKFGNRDQVCIRVTGRGGPSVTTPTHRYADTPILLKGWGMTNDSTHPVYFHSSGEAIAMAAKKALKMARLRPSEIDLIYVHGTGTVANDRLEANALRAVFGSVLTEIPITATKGKTGHLLGAAGAVELALACEMLANQFIIPTNCENLDPEFGDLRIVTEDSGFRIWDSAAFAPPTALSCKLHTILKLGYGFGGQIAAIVLGRA